jgi:hypothetical protein
MVHFVQFIDQQDTRLFVLQRAQKRAGAEELPAMQFRLQGAPIDAGGSGFQFDTKPLQRLIKLADGLLFVDSLVALQALDRCICGLGHSIGQLRFPAARWTFEQQWFMESGRQVNRCRGYRIGDIASST